MKFSLVPVRALRVPPPRQADWLETSHPLVKTAILALVAGVIGWSMGLSF